MKKITINKIDFINYRNFSDNKFEFSSNINLIIGENGSGKTNILEAISLLSPGRGLRSSNNEEMIKYDHDKYEIYFELNSKISLCGLENSYLKGSRGRKLKYNNEPLAANELPKLLNIIWLTTQMDGIFFGSSSNRRKFLDRIVYNFFPNHAKNLNKYEYFLKERKKILELSDWQNNSSWLDLIEGKIASEAQIIHNNRVYILENMQKIIDQFDSDFPRAKIGLANNLKINKHGFIETYLENMKIHRKKDFFSGRTNYGIHKTDLDIIHQTKNCYSYHCSTGEQKALLINLILSSIEFIMKETNYAPIILLDEIFNHLDISKKNQLIDYLLNINAQCFITNTDIISLEKLAKHSKIIKL